MDRDIQIKGLRKQTLSLLIGGGVLLLLVVWAVFSDHSTKLRVEGKSLIIGEVTKSAFNDYIRLSGQVKPASIIQVTAMEGGIVEKINVTEGSMVQKGDVILVLKNPNLNLQILDSEAQLAEKQNFLRNTQIQMEQDKLSLRQELLDVQVDVIRKKRAFEQQNALYAEKLTPRETYLQAEEDYQLARDKMSLFLERQKQDSIYRSTQVGQMEENLDNMKLNLSIVHQREQNLKIRATYNGQLGLLGSQEGQTISIGQNIVAGQMIGQINCEDEYKIEVNIDEHNIDRVTAGLTGTFMRQNTGYAVQISKVYPEVRNGQFRSDLVFVGERPDNIRVGQTYYIDLQLGEPTTSLLIPRGNFYSSTGGKWIFVLNEPGTEATQREIRIGRQNPQYYEVLEGLSKGEKVIVSGYENYKKIEKLTIQ